MDLSVVIPIHNEAKRLPIVHQLVAWLADQPITSEVILIENGSADDTLAQAQALARRYPGRVLARAIGARGKGRAVALGMLLALGDYRMMCDVDFSMPMHYIGEFWQRRHEADILIGSREATGARRMGEPARRHIMGRVFNGLVQALALPGVQDSQCGFKLFNASAAFGLFSRVTLAGMAMDVEALYLAQLHGYSLQEIGIPWVYDPDSRVRLVRDTLQMIRDIVLIRARHKTPAQSTLLENAR